MGKFEHLLIVEDTPSLARTYQAHLKSDFEAISIADTGARAIAAVERDQPTCILLDLKLPDMDGMSLLKRWTAEPLPCAIVVITANGSLSVAVDAMREGASDFIVKPVAAERLRTTVRNSVDTFQLKKVVATYEKAVDRAQFYGFVGKSLAMQAVYKTIEAAAPSRANVFVTGETGTGKELAARAIHSLSPREAASFVAINCGAIPKDLIESEMFGHVKGAFTGATADRVGAAQLADGGTLFLDELGEMPIDLQPKLLRFLQTGAYSRVGESAVRRSDIRIVAATNRDPLRAVREGRLREDLYYRLHVIPVQLPPLRERGADVLLLAEAFLERFGGEEGKTFNGFDRGGETWLVDQTWPGNVRELENLMHQSAVLLEGGQITSDMLKRLTPGLAPVQTIERDGAREPIASVDPSPLNGADSGGIDPLWLVEKRAIERAIALCRGNVSQAAEHLGLSPSTIYRKRVAWADASEVVSEV